MRGNGEDISALFSARVNIFEMPETRNIATCCLFSNGLELLIDERGLT